MLAAVVGADADIIDAVAVVPSVNNNDDGDADITDAVAVVPSVNNDNADADITNAVAVVPSVNDNNAVAVSSRSTPVPSWQSDDAMLPHGKVLRRYTTMRQWERRTSTMQDQEQATPEICPQHRSL